MTCLDTAGMRGKVAELLVEAYAMESGWDVYRAIREDSPVDLVFDCHLFFGQLLKIQVKRIYIKEGRHKTINLKRKNGDRYDPKDIDYIAAVDVDTRFIWFIPFEKLWDSKADQPLGRLRITEKWNKYILEAPHANR